MHITRDREGAKGRGEWQWREGKGAGDRVGEEGEEGGNDSEDNN